MSALTKVFVVLLVVLSLLLAAASVTFLNTLPNYQQQIATLTAANQAAQGEVALAQQQSEAQIRALEGRVAQLTSAMTAAQQGVTGLRAELAQSEAEKAQLQGQLAQSNTTQATLSSAVNSSQTVVQEIRGQLATLREQYDRTLQQFTESNRQLSETSAQLTYATRALREAQERNTELLSRTSDLTGALAQAGLDPENLRTGQIAPPPINGRILSVDTIGNKPYALISVGSEDDVKPGMRFTVLSTQNNEFLGHIVIERVDDTQSIGQLSGPKVNAVAANDEVRTRVSDL